MKNEAIERLRQALAMQDAMYPVSISPADVEELLKAFDRLTPVPKQSELPGSPPATASLAGTPGTPNSGFDSRDGGHDITWDEFEKRLIAAGWSPQDAKAEREANETGWLGDCDGDLEL